MSRRRKTMTRLGVTVNGLGSCQTYNGIAWSADVTVGGKSFRVSNAGNGGCDEWTDSKGWRVNEDCAETWKFIADLARREPALAEYADIMDNDAEAAGMFVSAMLDGAFLVETVR